MKRSGSIWDEIKDLYGPHPWTRGDCGPRLKPIVHKGLNGAAIFALIGLCLYFVFTPTKSDNPCTNGKQIECVKLMRAIKCPLISNSEGDVQACYP